MDAINPMAVWGIILVATLVILGLAMYFRGDRMRPLNRAERERSEQGARENWGKEEVH
ncbi:MAG TPA: hypothetical protein VIL09_08780 [Microvirga sp.]|jgi:hypothetical protein